MKTLQNYIDGKQREFLDHAFFRRLDGAESLDENLLAFARALTFWVMTFQDILRINEARVVDLSLRRIARHHMQEDAGHDRWFLSDLLAIDGTIPDVDWVFGPDHAATRAASYALISEVYRANTDHERIALLLTLESTGHVFFEKVSSYFERAQIRKTLRYFARTHLDVEKQHELFEERLMQPLFATELAPPVRQDCRAMVDRAYAAFDNLFVSIDWITQSETQDIKRGLVRSRNLRAFERACA
jgi:hypothetical protein